MRTGIFGDIHANLPAFDAVLDAMKREGVEQMFCLGDVVGYGADAKACIDRVRELEIPIVAGNHDWAVAGRLDLEYFNPHARAAVEWTRDALTQDDLDWLRGLEPLDQVGELTLAHGTMHDPEDFEYLQTPYDAYLSFQVMKTRVGFVGHSHIPVTFLDGMPITYSIDPVLALEGRRAIGNPGSVGQPRDEDPRAAFMVYDSEADTVSIHRTEYDIDDAAKRIIDAGLPPILADRLRVGR